MDGEVKYHSLVPEHFSFSKILSVIIFVYGRRQYACILCVPRKKMEQ